MLGENIQKLRKEKKLSQDQLAEMINVTRQTISNWELGQTQPNTEQLKLLSKAFNVSVDELIGNDIKCILEEKVSNTEKLAGIIIRLLKVAGIIFFAMLIIDLLSLIIFTAIKKETLVSTIEEVEIICHKENSDYLITIGSDAYFNCSNCPTKIQKELKKAINYSDLESNYEIVSEYFKNNNGICE